MTIKTIGSLDEKYNLARSVSLLDAEFYSTPIQICS
jgi:hypothetical protein